MLSLRCDRLPVSLQTVIQRFVHRRCHSSLDTPVAPVAVRLRFAPSPTGYLHLGGLRTALFNHLYARKKGGKWLLRIEDTDRARFVEGAVDSLVRTLRWAKLDFDEGPGKGGKCGPYVQSERKHIYDEHLQNLVDQGKAYHCFCSSDRLAAVRKQMQRVKSNSTYDRHCLHLSESEVQRRLDNGEKSVVRFKSAPKEMTQHDLVYEPIHYKSTGEEDFVLRKSDGLPTYHFANVVDDHLMGITHVLRGEEWLPSTPKHLDLYEALGWTPPQFAHMPILVNKDGSKLSKRMGDVRVEDYIDKGFEPEALLNFVALMGWSPNSNSSGTVEDKPENEAEVLTPDELVASFSIEGINKHRATMNLSKLNFLNRQHIARKLDEPDGRAEMVGKAKAALSDVGITCEDDDAFVVSVLRTLQDRLYTIKDLPTLGSYYFRMPDYGSEAARQLKKTVPLDQYQAILAEAAELADQNSTDSMIAKLLEGRNHKHVMSTLRHALTGQKVGAGVKATLDTLGPARTMSRLRAALADGEA